jgi:nitrate reductase gamma subunit
MTALFAIMFYAATAILAAGLAFKVVQYARTPAPLKIPTTPAPVSTSGIALRFVREVILFESLFKANKWIWLFGYIFHGALLLAMLRHLRYFIHPVWDWVVLVQPFGIYAGFAMLAGLGALWFRRVFVQRIRYISGPSDHLILILLIAITGSGLAMRYVARTDIVALKQFMLGLMRLDWQPMPADPILMAHLDHLPLFQAVACARPVLQPNPQPGRQCPREAPSGALGGAAGRRGRITWAITRHPNWANTLKSRRSVKGRCRIRNPLRPHPTIRRRWVSPVNWSRTGTARRSAD